MMPYYYNKIDVSNGLGFFRFKNISFMNVKIAGRLYYKKKNWPVKRQMNFRRPKKF